MKQAFEEKARNTRAREQYTRERKCLFARMCNSRDLYSDFYVLAFKVDALHEMSP